MGLVPHSTRLENPCYSEVFVHPDLRCRILWTTNSFGRFCFASPRGQHIFEQRIWNEIITLILDIQSKNMFGVKKLVHTKNTKHIQNKNIFGVKNCFTPNYVCFECPKQNIFVWKCFSPQKCCCFGCRILWTTNTFGSFFSLPALGDHTFSNNASETKSLPSYLNFNALSFFDLNKKHIRIRQQKHSSFLI